MKFIELECNDKVGFFGVNSLRVLRYRKEDNHLHIEMTGGFSATGFCELFDQETFENFITSSSKASLVYKIALV
jgi:sRNA-binding regulator protein Hfq